jgi:hypothetical protein
MFWTKNRIMLINKISNILKILDSIIKKIKVIKIKGKKLKNNE